MLHSAFPFIPMGNIYKLISGLQKEFKEKSGKNYKETLQRHEYRGIKKGKQGPNGFPWDSFF